MSYEVDEAEFYDPPEPKVHRLFNAPIEDITPQHPIPAPPPMPGPKPKDQYLAAVNAAMDILSYRLIILIAVVAEAAMFGFVVWAPDLIRMGAAGAFAVLVGFPLLYFYRNPK